MTVYKTIEGLLFTNLHEYKLNRNKEPFAIYLKQIRLSTTHMQNITIIFSVQ